MYRLKMLLIMMVMMMMIKRLHLEEALEVKRTQLKTSGVGASSRERSTHKADGWQREAV